MKAHDRVLEKCIIEGRSFGKQILDMVIMRTKTNLSSVSLLCLFWNALKHDYGTIVQEGVRCGEVERFKRQQKYK
jgi:hypothetical protein